MAKEQRTIDGGIPGPKWKFYHPLLVTENITEEWAERL